MNVGATYWGQRKGTLLWAEWDRGMVRDELQQLAGVGMRSIRLPLPWEDFQPRPERVAITALRALEQVLELAHDTQLQVVGALFPLAVAGAIHLPAWATSASFAADLQLSTKFGPLLLVRNDARAPLVWERTEHTSEVRDLWTNPALRTAQRKLIAEVVGYFAQHPALSGWELGSACELAHVPSSSDAAADWLGDTADAARQHGARGTLFYQASLRTLVRRDGPRPQAIVDAGCTPVINVVPPEPAWPAQALTPDHLLFVAALVRSLGGGVPWLMWGAPSVANGGGRTFADRAYGRAVEQPLFDHDEYALLAEAALPQLQAKGVGGTWLEHAFCYRTPFVPATAHSRREQMMGMIDADGTELPIASAMRRAAEQPVSSGTMPLPEINVEAYWNDPQGNFAQLWQAWRTRDEA